MLLLQYITEDIKETTSYLSEGIMFGLFISVTVFTISCLLTAKSKEKQSARALCQILGFFLLGTYLYIALQQAFFSRPSGSRNAVNFVLFGTWGTSSQSRAYVIENIILFYPLGVLLPMISKSMRKYGWLCVFTGMLSSIILEAVQYLTRRGFCQLDDIVMNTLGTLLGWTTYKIIKRFLNHIRQRGERDK